MGLAWFYRLYVVAVVGLFVVASARGWRIDSGPRERIPPSVRSSPGGYRSFHFWHTGFSGGK